MVGSRIAVESASSYSSPMSPPPTGVFSTVWPPERQPPYSIRTLLEDGPPALLWMEWKKSAPRVLARSVRCERLTTSVSLVRDM